MHFAVFTCANASVEFFLISTYLIKFRTSGKEVPVRQQEDSVVIKQERKREILSVFHLHLLNLDHMSVSPI